MCVHAPSAADSVRRTLETERTAGAALRQRPARRVLGVAPAEEGGDRGPRPPRSPPPSRFRRGAMRTPESGTPTKQAAECPMGQSRGRAGQGRRTGRCPTHQVRAVLHHHLSVGRPDPTDTLGLDPLTSRIGVRRDTLCVPWYSISTPEAPNSWKSGARNQRRFQRETRAPKSAAG